MRTSTLLTLFLSLFCALAALAEGSSSVSPDRNRFFNCKGHEVQIADSEPNAISGAVNAVIQVKGTMVLVSGAWPFSNDALPIVSENDIEIKFSRFVSTSAFGDAGTFNKVTGKLRLDVTDGVANEPQKVKVHWWGDYVCKATKKVL